MKKMVLFLSAYLLIGVSGAQIIIDEKISGKTTKVIAAPEYIRMMPGFEYKPVSQNYFRAYIDENASSILPVTYQEYIDPEKRELDFDLPVGSTAGMASVSLTGAANYTIPIFCPPGTAGLQPSLSLAYSSQAGNGIAGYGWNLTGLSAITRVPHTIHHDGAAKGIDFIDDRFALDGQRLFCLGNNYGEDNSEYYTEVFNGAKIIAHGQEFGDPVWFEILNKDGSVMRYGFTDVSRFNSQKGNPISWYLDRITDANGNYIDYKYNSSNVEKVVTEILYTGNQSLNQEPYNSIKFWYKDRTDKSDYIIAGAHVKQTLLLNHIDILAEGRTIKTYRLKHFFNTYSKLNEVEEFGSEFSRLNSIVFGYDDTENENVVYNTQIEPGNCNILYGDFNGDGKPDIFRAVLSGDERWQVFLNKGNGLYVHNIPDWFDDLNPRREYYFTVADINGDGFSDIVYGEEFHEIFVGDWRYLKCLLGGTEGFTKITLNEKTSAFTKVDVIPYAIDINGDGKSEILLHHKDMNNVYEDITISNIITENGTGNIIADIIFEYKLKARNIHSELDITGDGASELMIIGEDDDTYIYTYSYNGSSFTDKQIYRSGYPSMWHNVYLDDFNGDGITDLLTNVEDNFGIHTWQLAYWIGNGFETIELLNLEGLLQGDSRYGIVANDYNSDGKADIMLVYGVTVLCSGGVCEELRIKPYHFENNNFIPSPESTIVATEYQFMQGHWKDYLYQRPFDLNGDGNSDVSLMDNNKLHKIVKINPNEYKSGLKIVSNGLNMLSKFEYKNLSNPQVYNKGPVLAYPYRRLVHPMQVVSTYNHSNGLGDFAKTDYSYKSGTIHLKGKGFLGFKAMESVDQTNGIKSYSESEIDLSKVFMKPVFAETKDLDGNLLSRNEFYYQFANIYQAPASVMFPYAATTIAVDNFSGAKSVAQIEYDQYGNLTVSTNSVYQTVSSTNPVETQITSLTNFVNAGGWCPSKPNDQSINSHRQGEADFITRKYFTYTAQGNPETITDFYQQDSALITTYSEYNAGLPKTVRMHVAKHTDNASDRVITTIYDNKYRFAESVTDAMGYTSSAKFDPGFGNKLEVTDANGLKAYMEYDGFGSLVESRNHLGIWSKNDYYWKKTDDNVLYFLETTSNNAPPGQEYYDLLGRPLYTFAENPDGKMVCMKTDYDQRGRVISVSEPYFKDSQPTQFTTTQYDNYNRTWKTTLPTGVVITQNLQQPGSNSYTVSTHNSGTSITTTQTSDASGKTITATDPGGTLVYSYYSHGNAKSITSPDGSIFSMQYDEYGRQTSLSDPDAGTIHYSYNAFGELTGQIDANLNTFEMVYDKAGRLLNKKCTRPDYNTELTNTWHPANASAGSRGKLQKTEYTDENSKYSLYEYTYNNISQTTHTRITSDRIFNYFYTYDSKGRPDEYTYPTDLTIKNEYNPDNGTLKKVIAKNSNTTIYEPGTYNARGQMMHFAMNNKSLYTTFGYDDYGLPTYRMTGNYYPTSSNIQNLQTNFDPSTGNLNWRKDLNRNLTELFTYDEVHKNRLATWQVKWQQLYSTTYNNTNGNILTKTDFTSPGNPYTYGLGAGPHAVTGVVSPLIVPAEAEQEIRYNSFNKASRIIHHSQDMELVLHYGPDEQRIKTEYKINGQPTLTHYFPGGGLEVEVNEETNEERWLHYLPGGGLYVCDKEFNKIGMYYVLTDYLGSAHKVISETGATVEEYSFDPWGRRRNPTNWTYTGLPSSFTFNRGYTGHEMLDTFGLVNMNGRMYDPVLGRMLSPDNYVSSPGSTQAFNRYSYALNNPLVYTDPDGNNPILLPIIIGAIAGGYTGYQIADAKGYDFSDWQSWAYMLGGAAIGGVSGAMGFTASANMGFMSNTFGITYSSFFNSMGMTALSGGIVKPSVSFGFGSFDFGSGKFSSIFDWENLNTMERVGYTFGALANIQDVVAGFSPTDYQYQFETSKGGKVGHGNIREVVTDVDGNISTDVKISIANRNTITTKHGGIRGAIEYAWKSNFNKYSGGPEYWLDVPEEGWYRMPLKLNPKIIDWMANNLENNMGLWGIDRTRFGLNYGCVSYSARALWTVGVPTIPVINYLGPKVLWFQLAIRQAGIYSSPYLYNGL